MLSRIAWMPVLVASACGFSVSTMTGSPGTETTVTIADDDLADGQILDGVLVAPGVIEPDGFVLGGLHARGFQAALVVAGEDFDTILAKADATGATGAAYAQVPADWVLARPRGLGLTANNTFTVIWTGEILLPKGTVTLETDADDRGLVELALDPDQPTTFGQTLVANVTGGADAITFTVPEPGWYPIRAALTEDSGNARLPLVIVQGQVRTPVGADRLRARVTAAQGVVVYVFDGQGFVGPVGHAARPTIDEAFAALAPPYDLTTSIDRFSLRFAGQLRIDTPGTYEFAGELGIDADDGFRLWIDGALVAHHWLGHADVPKASIDLAAGWHDLVVDYADEIGNAQIRLTMTGPDAPAGGAIDPQRLRPVVVRGNTFTFANITTPITIMDGMTTFVPLPLEGTPVTLIDSVDYGFRIDNQDMSTLAISLVHCAGSKPLAVNPTPSYHYYPADADCANTTTNPAVDWLVRINDSAVGNGIFVGLGSIRDYGVTALYRGGPNMPYAPVVKYTSGTRATPGALRVEAARAIGTLAGVGVEIELRTGADEASLQAAPFELVREGASIAGGELIQYRVTITSDGWQYPVLDKVEIDYVVPGEDP